MAVHLTEEEQLESLKRWWKENGKSTVIAVLLGVVGYLGWGTWKDRQLANSVAASSFYQNLVEALQLEQGQSLTEEQTATVKHLAGELKDKFDSNLYASQAALFLARLAVDAGDLQQAAVELQWVIERDVDPALTLLTRSRLARVHIAQGDLDAALSLVKETKNTAFTATFAELRGDILLQKGQPNEARAAYRLAMDNLVAGQEARSQLLQIKLNNLQGGPVVVTSPETDLETKPEPTPEPEAFSGENS